MEPKTIIEAIRKEYTGEGLVADPDWSSVVKRNNEALSRALKQLSENLYKKEFHFIMELIQNAEDNQYHKKIKPFINFTLYNDRLIVKNNETGFSEENVRAICDVNKTTKKKIEGYIGEKGIGFKSVFKVSESPEIYSNGFRFRFKSGSGSKNLLAYILPEWIDNVAENIEPNCTNIVLPFKKNNTDEFKQQLERIHPNLLLFLKKICKIVIYDVSSGTQRTLQKKVLKDGIVQVSEYKERNGNIFYTKEYYYYLNPFSYNVNNKALAGSDERKGIKSTEIIIGFPLEKSKGGFSLLTNEKCFLYSFLPIKDVGFRFLIQADFILNSSREDIDEAKPWNDWILEKISLSLKTALLSLKQTPYWQDYLNFIPREKEISDDTFNNLASELINSIKEYQIIPVKSSENINWLIPSKAIQHHADADVIFGNAWIKSCIKKELFHPLFNIDSDVCNIFDIDDWRWEHVVSCLKNPKYISSLNEANRNRLYAYLSDTCIDDSDMISELKDLPLFFVNDSQIPQSFNQSEDAIFWPLDSRFNYSFLDSLRFLKTDYIENKSVQNQKIRNLFTEVGVSNASIKMIVRKYIILKYSEGDNIDTAGKHLTKYSVEYFRFLIENYSSIRKDAELFKKLKDNIWLHSNSNKKHNRPASLYLGTCYQKLVEWDKFLIGDEVSYLSPAYKNALDGTQINVALKFLDEIGIKHTADISHLVNVFNSANTSKIKFALIYLDSHWDSYKTKPDVKTLKSAVVFPVNGELFKPSEIFTPSKKNRRILKNSVSYLPGFIKSKDFIHDIGVNDYSIPNNNLIQVLASLKKSKNQDRHFLLEVYKEFRKDKELIGVFSKERLIYCFLRKKWIHSWEAIWSIDDDNFDSIFSEIKSQYPSLKIFFLDDVGITSGIDFYNISSYIDSLSETAVINDEQRRYIENALIFLISNYRKGKIKKEEIEGLNAAKFVPVQNNTLVSPDDAYFADDLHLYEIFKNDEIYLFKLSGSNSGYKNLLKPHIDITGIQVFSNSVQSAVNPDSSFHYHKALTSDFILVIKEITYVIYHRFRDIYVSLPESIKFPRNLKCFLAEKIIVNYSLNNFTHIEEEEIFVQGTDIYISKFDENSKIVVFQKVLFNYFLNTEEIKDIIIHLVGIRSLEEFNSYLFSHGIPIPQKESDLNIRKKSKKLSKISDADEGTEPNVIEPVPDKATAQNGTAKDKITIEVHPWIPDVEPDFLVSIEAIENADQDSLPFNTSASANKSNSFFPSYRFIKNNGNESEIGDWGESFVFNNLVAQLKKQFSVKDFVCKTSPGSFAIYDKKDLVIASLSNGNEGGFNQSGYDFLKIIRGVKTYIEVKTTTRLDTGKYILKKEQWNCCRANPDNYELFFVKGAGNKKASIFHVPDFFRKWEKGLISVIPHNLEIFI